MAAIQDPKLRPVYADRQNQRLFADPVGAGPWPEVQVGYGSLPALSANVVLGRGATSGAPQPLSADVTIALLNTATSAVIDAARVAAGSTTGAGVLQLTDSVSSISTTTAATPAAVKSAYDLAAAALPKAGGTMTGDITFAGTQVFPGTLATSAIGTTVQAYDADTAKTDLAQTYTKAQRGAYVALTDAATIALDLSLSNNYFVTLAGNRTLGAPTNVVAGQTGVILVIQDGTGSRTLAYNAVFKFPGGTAPTLTTAANSVDMLVYHVESTTRITVRFIGDVK